MAGRLPGLGPKSFIWNRTGYAGIGYIAEDVNALLPEICRWQGGTKGYDLWKLPFFIIEGLIRQRISPLCVRVISEMLVLKGAGAVNDK